jgi:hypothetical protein
MDESMANPQFASGLMIGYAAAVVVLVATLWRIFSKAGESGWKCLIPIYSAVVFQRIVGRPVWWMLLMLVPVVNIVISIVECVDLAKSFGKGAGYALGLIFLGPIFAMILAFGPAKYVGPGGKPRYPTPVPMGAGRTTAMRPAAGVPVNRKAA